MMTPQVSSAASYGGGADDQGDNGDEAPCGDHAGVHGGVPAGAGSSNNRIALFCSPSVAPAPDTKVAQLNSSNISEAGSGATKRSLDGDEEEQEQELREDEGDSNIRQSSSSATTLSAPVPGAT